MRDRYDNKFFGIFARLLRYAALLISLTASSIFVALTSFHTDILPIKYAISISEMRATVPVGALIGALSLEFIMELLREALLRVPKQIGPAIGIVGAIVIGSAAISAGIFSPILLIIVSTSLLASFAIPDYSLVNPFRILKFILLLFTGTLGFFGFTTFMTFILAELVSLNSFGVPYFAPLAPFNLRDLKGHCLTTKLRAGRPIISVQKKKPGEVSEKQRKADLAREINNGREISPAFGLIIRASREKHLFLRIGKRDKSEYIIV